MKNSRNKKFASFKQHYTALELFCLVIILTNLLVCLIYRLNPIIGVCAGIRIVYWVEGQSAAAADPRLGVLAGPVIKHQLHRLWCQSPAPSSF